jgi:hypothetical protein
MSKTSSKDGNLYRPTKKLFSSGSEDDLVGELTPFFYSKIIDLKTCVESYIKKYITQDVEGPRFSEKQLEIFTELLGIRLVYYAQEGDKEFDVALSILDLVYGEPNLNGHLKNFIDEQFGLYLRAKKDDKLLNFINFFLQKPELKPLINDLTVKYRIELEPADANSDESDVENKYAISATSSEGSSESSDVQALGSAEGSTETSDAE